MIAIDNTLVSEHLLEKKFVCDLEACKGACCVQGESGAPLEKEELQVLEDIYEEVKPYMAREGRMAIDKQGFYVIDEDGDYTTPLIKGAQCAFVYFDKGVASCAIEKAYREGKITFKKPISCHLYPVRITKYKEYDAVNYHKWHVCKPACECGARLDVPVYRFLKEPLIRRYGEEWYAQLCAAAEVQK